MVTDVCFKLFLIPINHNTGKKLIIRNAKEMIEKLEESADNEEIYLQACFSLPDDTDNSDSVSMTLNLLEEHEDEKFQEPSDDLDQLQEQLSQKQIKRDEIQ